MTNGEGSGDGEGGGVIGAVAKPVNNVVAALKESPLLLVLVLLNAAMFGMLTYLILKSAEYRFKERDQLMQTLNSCITLLDEAEHPHGGASWRDQAQKMSPLPPVP